jgi:phosphoribosylamine--glycine ligase
MKRKGIQIIPSAMMGSARDGGFKSDGTRVAYLNANLTVKPDENRGHAAERFRKKIFDAFRNGKIRVIPREDPLGNRLDLRQDIGVHYLEAEKIFR